MAPKRKPAPRAKKRGNAVSAAGHSEDTDKASGDISGEECEEPKNKKPRDDSSAAAAAAAGEAAKRVKPKKNGQKAKKGTKEKEKRDSKPVDALNSFELSDDDDTDDEELSNAEKLKKKTAFTGEELNTAKVKHLYYAVKAKIREHNRGIASLKVNGLALQKKLKEDIDRAKAEAADGFKAGGDVAADLIAQADVEKRQAQLQEIQARLVVRRLAREARMRELRMVAADRGFECPEQLKSLGLECFEGEESDLDGSRAKSGDPVDYDSETDAQFEITAPRSADAELDAIIQTLLIRQQNYAAAAQYHAEAEHDIDLSQAVIDETAEGSRNKKKARDELEALEATAEIRRVQMIRLCSLLEDARDRFNDFVKANPTVKYNIEDVGGELQTAVHKQFERMMKASDEDYDYDFAATQYKAAEVKFHTVNAETLAESNKKLLDKVVTVKAWLEILESATNVYRHNKTEFEKANGEAIKGLGGKKEKTAASVRLAADYEKHKTDLERAEKEEEQWEEQYAAARKAYTDWRIQHGVASPDDITSAVAKERKILKTSPDPSPVILSTPAAAAKKSTVTGATEQDIKALLKKKKDAATAAASGAKKYGLQIIADDTDAGSGAGAVQTGPPTCVQCSQTGKAFSLTVDVEDDTLVLLHAPRTGKHDLAKKSGKYIHLKCISLLMQSVAKPPYAHDASAAHSQAFRIDWVAYLDAAKANSPTGSVALDPLMAKFLDEKCRAFDPSKELIQACKAMYWSADCVTEQAKMHCFKQFVGRAHVWSYAAQQMSVRLTQLNLLKRDALHDLYTQTPTGATGVAVDKLPDADVLAYMCETVIDYEFRMRQKALDDWVSTIWAKKEAPGNPSPLQIWKSGENAILKPVNRRSGAELELADEATTTLNYFFEEIFVDTPRIMSTPLKDWASKTAPVKLQELQWALNSKVEGEIEAAEAQKLLDAGITPMALKKGLGEHFKSALKDKKVSAAVLDRCISSKAEVKTPMVKAAASSSAAAAHAGAAAAPVTSAIPNDGDETMAPAGGEAVEVIPDDSADTPGSDMKGAQPANGKSLSEAEELNPTSTNWTFRPIFTKEHVNKPPRNWTATSKTLGQTKMLYYAYRWLRFRERYCDANKITFNFGVECAKCVRTTTKDDPVKALATYQKSWYHIGVLWDICGYEAMKEVYETYITECKENNAKNDKEKPKHALDVLKRLCYRALSGTHLKRFEALQAKHFKVKAK